jgi:transposase-like protein
MTIRASYGEPILTMWPVSARVSSVRNNDPSPIGPVTLEDAGAQTKAITGVARRRRLSTELKLAVDAEPMEPGMSVSFVARRHGLSPSLMFCGRQLMSKGGKERRVKNRAFEREGIRLFNHKHGVWLAVTGSLRRATDEHDPYSAPQPRIRGERVARVRTGRR